MVTTIASILLLAVPGADPEPKVGVYSYHLGKKYAVLVTQAALDKAPVWKADADDPPLSARKAMKAAGAARARLVPDTADWKWDLRSAALWEASPGRWYWEVTFVAEYPRGGVVGRAPTLRLVVLMDGTVVEPEVSEDKPKR